ncbi:MAG: glycosyltransferase [Pseudomonadota bacterium]
MIGAVVIGRNEGERLVRCLDSLSGIGAIVYVDSGSTDGSVEAALAAGAEVVELNTTEPFTAARARNAGLARLTEIAAVSLVQFVDGDCELRSGWIQAASEFLNTHPLVAVVCGRRRERFPDASIYNRLCDLEWDTPCGQTKACGGDALMRVQPLIASGGYRSDLIAGEEPELCVRLRSAGWQVWRLDHEMTHHDAAMTRFGQWWTRTRRGGFAAAEAVALHGAPPEYHGVQSALRAVAWAFAFPFLVLTAAIGLSPWALLLLALYPMQVVRLARKKGHPERISWIWASSMVLGKFAEFAGIVGYLLARLTRRKMALIEYKEPAAPR